MEGGCVQPPAVLTLILGSCGSFSNSVEVGCVCVCVRQGARESACFSPPQSPCREPHGGREAPVSRRAAAFCATGLKQDGGNAKAATASSLSQTLSQDTPGDTENYLYIGGPRLAPMQAALKPQIKAVGWAAEQRRPLPS